MLTKSHAKLNPLFANKKTTLIVVEKKLFLKYPIISQNESKEYYTVIFTL